jgi:hypothetical protein
MCHLQENYEKREQKKEGFVLKTKEESKSKTEIDREKSIQKG